MQPRRPSRRRSEGRAAPHRRSMVARGGEAIDLEDWTSTRIRTRDLKRAAPLPGRIERFRVLEATGSEVVVERDGERIVVPRPASWVPAAEVPGIAVEDGIRLVAGGGAAASSTG